MDEKELVVLLDIVWFIEGGKEFGRAEELGGRMRIKRSECWGVLRKVVEMEIVWIEEGV
ncbi:hypothetical protein [Siminovitchia fortis]|uniref:hypothetical protein n=1 Tax=Siminovitchia fortis TaxID=254758 RepID=UPI001642AB17|nr:hypothetical protein [Siminovitchia fortis]